MASNVTKSDYLKRYLEDDKKKKRKIKKPSLNATRIKIHEINIDLKSIKFGEEALEEEDDTPIVAEVIDERPEEVKIKELYESARWKKLGEDDEADPNNMENNKSQNRGTSSQDTPGSGNHQKRQRHDSDSDNSPPRTQTHHTQDRQDKSPKHSHRNDSDRDVSPARSKTSHRSERKNRRNDSDSDVSVPRNSHGSRNSKTKHSHDSDSDLSPERRAKSRSSTTRGGRKQIDENSDSDLSPPRGSQKGRGDRISADSRRPGKTLSGLKAGLQNADTLKRENKALREREQTQINQLDEELSGRNADTIVRDRRTGKKRDLDEENRVKEQKEKIKSQQEQKYSEWGKGVEQNADRANRLSEDLHEMYKPLARYQGDHDLEERQKAADREGDTMLAYIKKKKLKGAVSDMPEYQGPPPPPNRYGIRPGYRWDGVDRSNGFEKKYFEKNSSNKAMQEESYLWSVQDM